MTELAFNDRSLATNATEGLRNLELGDWSAATSPVDQFRALIALRVVLAGYLVGSVSRETDPNGVTRIRVAIPDQLPTNERASAARLLLAPLSAYVQIAGMKAEFAAPDTGALPLPVLVVAGAVAVSVVAAQAYVISSIARDAAKVVDNSLKRKATSAEIQRADAEALKVINNHVQREIAAGRTLALDDASKSVLADLQNRVGKLVQLGFESTSERLSSPWVLPVVGVAAVAVVAAVYYLKKRKQK